MYKKGDCGNPKGRPVTPDSIKEIIEKRLGKQGRLIVADHLIDLCKAGNETALVFVAGLLQEKTA